MRPKQGSGLVCQSLPNSLPLSILSSFPLSLPLSCPLSLPIVLPNISPNLSPIILFHFIANRYSLIISGQSLDLTNSREAPPSCTICRRWYLGLWCPCTVWRPPCPPGSRPGPEARQGRRMNTGGSLSPSADWSLSGAILTIFLYYSKLCFLNL